MQNLQIKMASSSSDENCGAKKRKVKRKSTRRLRKHPASSHNSCSSNTIPWELRFKGMLNIIGRLFLFLVLLVSLVIVMFLTIPEVVASLGFTEWKHRLFVTYTFGAAVGNLILAIATNTTLKKAEKSTSNKWRDRLSSESRMDIPIRAHYCRLCESVIVKHDHHCYMLGRCIGYFNQKYFIWFCGHTTTAAFYCLFQTALYLSLAYGVEFPGAWTYFVLLPQALRGWLTGETESSELALTFFLYICLIGGLVACGFFVWEMAIVTMGLTTHEALYGQKTKLKRRKGMLTNWTDVFGRYWFIGQFLPLPLPQCGNGLYLEAEN